MLTGFFKQIEEKVRNMLDNCWTPYVKIHIVKAGKSVRMTGFNRLATRTEDRWKGSGSREKDPNGYMTGASCNDSTGENAGIGGHNVTQDVTETEEEHGIKGKNPELCNYRPSGRTGQKWMKPRYFLANSDLPLIIYPSFSQGNGNMK